MIKRVVYNRSNGQILKFLPTNKTTSYISNDFDLYVEVEGNEALLSNISGLKELLLEKVKTNINKKTEDLIDNGFEYQGINFRTDQIAQQNFTGLFNVKEMLSYPYTIWDGDESLDVPSEAELANFCITVLQFVESKRQEGKALRDNLSSLSEINLINYVDPR